MNKCNVHFVCLGTQATCENFAFATTQDRLSKSHNNCEYGEYGYCTCKKAQIKALQDEGIEVTE
jgi:hypothetical protein